MTMVAMSNRKFQETLVVITVLVRIMIEQNMQLNGQFSTLPMSHDITNLRTDVAAREGTFFKYPSPLMADRKLQKKIYDI